MLRDIFILALAGLAEESEIRAARSFANDASAVVRNRIVPACCCAKLVRGVRCVPKGTLVRSARRGSGSTT